MFHRTAKKLTSVAPVGALLTVVGLMTSVATTPAAGHAARAISIVITVTERPEDLPPLELCALPDNRRIALTTMWDDGPASTFPGGGDLRMSHLLRTNAWKGTFGWALPSGAIADCPGILADGMEVASHTATHPLLLTRTRDAIFWEFLTSKIYLSVLTQRPVVTYADAFLAHDGIIDREFYQAGFLVGRGGSGHYTIFDSPRRHALPSLWLDAVGTNGFRATLESLYATAPEGTVQGLWGHAYPPEFGEETWEQFGRLLSDYRNRADTWYATWSEVGSQMFLRNAAQLGNATIGTHSARYTLHIDALPRDLLAIPLTLRLAGTPEQLRTISMVKADGVPLPAQITNGVLLCRVPLFAEDLYPASITADLSQSRHPTVAQSLPFLPVISNSYLEASWIWHETNGGYRVEVAVTNLGVNPLEHFAFEVCASSTWCVTNTMDVPTVLAPLQVFRANIAIAPAAGASVGGWTAFAGRLDYVCQGRPKAHYLFRDEILPLSPASQPSFIAPNCLVAGPIAGSASNLTDILTQAAGQWTRLPYDPSDRPTVINLIPAFFPASRLSPGTRVLSTGIIAETGGRATLKLTQRPSLRGLRFWLNGVELSGADEFPVDLRAGLNRLVAVCDAVEGISPIYTGPQLLIAAEIQFYQPDGTTPLTGVTFTADNTPPILSDIAGKTVCPGWTLNFSVAGTDFESLPERLTYSLVPPVLNGATIEPHSGLFRLTPTLAHAASTNSFTVRVTDDGVPPLNAEQSFTVVVASDGCARMTCEPTGGGYALTWLTLPGRTYRVEFKNNLEAAAWEPLEMNRFANGDSMTVHLASDGPSQRFFRIVRVD